MTLLFFSIALLGLAALVAILLVRPRGASPPLPIGPGRTLARAARRTTRVLAALAFLAGALVAAAYLLAPRPTGRLDELVPAGRSTVVVLDVSQSVSDLVYQEIARTLEGIVTAAGDSRNVGLVLFSDVAQEAIPPGSDAAALRPFIRYFRPRQERGVPAKPFYYRSGSVESVQPTAYPVSPWYGRFSGGTKISTGLSLARVALARHGAGGLVVLVSDLADAEDDLPRLTRELVAYERDPGLELKVVALPAAKSGQKALFRRLTGASDSVVDSLSLATGNSRAGEPKTRLPLAFIAIVVLLGLALAANELFGRTFSWRQPGPDGARP